MSPGQLRKKIELKEKIYVSNVKSLCKISSEEWLKNNFESLWSDLLYSLSFRLKNLRMAIQDVFWQINYLSVSALSHSQERNGEKNRKDTPWRPPGLTGIRWTLKESNNTAWVAPGQRQQQRWWRVNIGISIGAGAGLINMAGKPPEEYWLHG